MVCACVAQSCHTCFTSVLQLSLSGVRVMFLLENVNNFIPIRKYICLIVKYIADFDFAISLYIYIFMFSCIHTYIHTFFVCSYMYV